MKLIVTLAILTFLCLPVKAQTLVDKTNAISGALFVPLTDGRARFECSGFVFEKVPHGYLFATARHCAMDENDKVDFHKKLVSFNADESNPTPAYLVGVSKTDDVAVYDVDTTLDLPLIPLGDETKSKAGDVLINSNYMLDAGKLTYFGHFVAPKFAHKSPLDTLPEWANDMPIDITIAPGASGSVLVDAEQQAIVGLVVGGFQLPEDNVSIEVAIPVSRLITLRGTIWDKQSMETITPPKNTNIPADIFLHSFGKDHPFLLTVHGPNPVFIQNGYKFQVESDGFELSDEYYYNSQVYIDYDPDILGAYRLYTTKPEHYSLSLTLLDN